MDNALALPPRKRRVSDADGGSRDVEPANGSATDAGWLSIGDDPAVGYVALRRMGQSHFAPAPKRFEFPTVSRPVRMRVLTDHR